jgi:hypothetical protein
MWHLSRAIRRRACGHASREKAGRRAATLQYGCPARYWQQLSAPGSGAIGAVSRR